MALKLDILANTRDLVSNMKKAGESVEDVSDALDDLAKDGGRDGEKLERTFKDLAREAKKTDKAVQDIGDRSGGGFAKAGAASGEFKDEALSNFSEVTSSFDGSMSSISELAQGTLGGVAANLPGIGVAAGVAAAGLGAITARFTELGEENKRIKDGIIADAIELGDALDKEAVDARVRDLLGTENTKKQAELLAEILQVNLGEAALILAGDFESAGTTIEQVMEGVNNASGDVNYDTWIDLKNTIDATTGALEGAEQAAEAVATADKRTADAAKKNQATIRDEVGKTRSVLEGLTQVPRNVDLRFRVDESQLQAAQRRAEAWARNGLRVAVTGTLSGRTWE